MTRKINCMNCMVGRFKDDLCDEKMCEALKRVGNSDDFVDIIMLAKDIVRCKDCKHYEFADNRAFGMPVKYCDWFGFEDVDDYDFCSRGERGEE